MSFAKAIVDTVDSLFFLAKYQNNIQSRHENLRVDDIFFPQPQRIDKEKDGCKSNAVKKINHEVNNLLPVP